MLTRMADEAGIEGAAAPHTPNGVAAPSATSPKLSRAQKDAADRAAFLAADLDEDPAAPVKPAKAPAKPVKPATDDEAIEDVEDDADDEIEDEVDDLLEEADDLEDEVEEVEDDVEDAGKEDPELAKRLAKVRKHEQRIRDQAATRDKEFEQRSQAFIAEWKPKIEAAEAFEKAKGRIRTNTVDVLVKLGLTEDDFEDAARELYAASPNGSKDPKNKDAALRTRREKEQASTIDELRKRLDERDAKDKESAATAASQQAAEKHMRQVEKSVGDNTPLLKKRLETAPKAARSAMLKVAIQLADKTGGFADPKKVAIATEKKYRALAGLSGTEAAAEPAKGKPAKLVTKPGAIKVIDKTTPEPMKPAKAGSLLPSRTDMIDRLAKIERGEIDPDAD